MALELTKTSATKIQQIERLKIAMDILESVKDQHTGVMVNFFNKHSRQYF